MIGGGSLNGGEGTVLGTLIGCLIMSVLNNGCVHAGIPNASQDVIIGAIIVAAVALDRFRTQVASRSDGHVDHGISRASGHDDIGKRSGPLPEVSRPAHRGRLRRDPSCTSNGPRVTRRTAEAPPSLSVTRDREGLGRARHGRDQVGVVTQATTAKEALTSNSEAMSTLQDAPQGAGGRRQGHPDERRSRSHPQYSQPPPRSGGRSRQDSCRGSSATGSRTRSRSRARQIDKLGALLDAVVEAGANRCTGSASGSRTGEAARRGPPACRWPTPSGRRSCSPARRASCSARRDDHRGRPGRPHARSAMLRGPRR